MNFIAPISKGMFIHSVYEVVQRKFFRINLSGMFSSCPVPDLHVCPYVVEQKNSFLSNFLMFSVVQRIRGVTLTSLDILRSVLSNIFSKGAFPASTGTS